MASERVGDMTKQELEAFVIHTVAERFRRYPYVQKSNRSPDELWKSILENIVETRPDEPSTLELLREDRDR